MNDEEKIIDIIENHDVEALNQWIDEGGDPNFLAGRNQNKSTLLQHVLHKIDIEKPENDVKSISMLQLLIDKGADVNLAPCQYFFPIKIAVDEQKPQMVKILLDAGVNINVFIEEDKTVLVTASINEDIETLKLLIPYSDEDLINTIGGIMVKSPIGFAFQKTNLTMIELLLKHGADPYLNDWDEGGVMFDSIASNASKETLVKINELIKKYYC